MASRQLFINSSRWNINIFKIDKREHNIAMEPVIDHAPLESLLVRLGQLADLVPEIVEIDLNPIIATPDGLHVVDLRIRAVPYLPHPERSVRRMR